MKKSVSLLLSLIMVISIITSLPLTASAASTSDLTFELNEDGKSYKVCFCKESATGKVTIPKKYKNKPVTGIGESAFLICDKITSLSIPDTIEFIEDEAFSYDVCQNITAVYITDIEAWCKIEFGNWNANPIACKGKLYLNGSLIEKVVIPKGVTQICSYLFKNCTKLTSVTIPDGVTWIGESAFENCTSLKSITIPDSVKSLNFMSFGNCTALTSVRLSNGLSEIAGISFFGCKNLVSIKIPDSVTSIGYRAFFDCTSLKSIIIPKKVKEIWSEAFGYYENSDLDSKKVKGFTIYGFAGTASEEYAKDNGFTFKKVTKPGKTTLTTVTNTRSGVKITWEKVTTATEYEVYRKTSNSSYKKIATTTSTSYTDKTAKSGTKYYYVVKCVNVAGKSGYSSSLSKYCLADPTLKTPSSTKSGITLKWTKVTGAQGYIIYRKTGSGSYTKLKTEKGVSNLAYTDKSAKKGKTYTYKVKAYKSKTYSAYSNVKKIKDKY